MSTAGIIMYSLAAAGAAAGLTIVLMLMKSQNVISVETEEWQIKSRHFIQKYYRIFVLKVYRILSGIPLLNIFMENLASMFSNMYVLDNEESKRRAVSLLMCEGIVGVTVFIVGVRYFNDTLLAMILTVMVMMYAYQKLRGDGQRFLQELEEMIGDMVHMYNAEGRNIDRMFNRILEDRDSYMYPYMEQMYECLKEAIYDPSDRSFIVRYNSEVASRHLRLLYNYLYITYRYGDEVSVTGEQMFNRALLKIQREVHNDLMKIVRIKEATIGEQWFIVLSVAMIPCATWYMKEFFTFDGFESISRFLNSSFGYTIKVACAVLALVCYYVYVKLNEANMALKYHGKISWEETILNRSKKLRDLTDFLAPKRGTKRREKLEYRISMSEGYVGVRPLYLRKLCAGVAVACLVGVFLSADTYTNYRGITRDIYHGVNKEFMDTVISLEEYPEEYKSRSLSNDMLVINILKEHSEEYFSLGTAEERVGYIEQIILDHNIDYGLYYEIAAQRISEKYVLLGKLDPKWILMILVFSFFGAYTLPDLAIRLNLALNRGAIMYDEVNGYYTVVVLLINHRASNIYMMLDWLASFADVFKTRIQSCVDNLCEAELRELDRGIKYKPFSRLVECLLLAYKGVDLKDAFEGIEQKHLFQEESRRIINERVIAKRVGYSQALSWTAMGFTFCMYIVAPMIFAIVEMVFQLM